MKNTLRKDIILYSAGTIIPTLVGLLRSPIFTRYFTPSEYGYYSIVAITFSFISIILFTSLSGCVWRYYIRYKSGGTLPVMYSNLALLYVFSFTVVTAISLIWTYSVSLPVMRNLIVLCFFNYLTAEIIGFYLIIYKLESKAFGYNILQSIKTSSSFILLILLTFVFHFRIEALLISNIIVQLLILIYLALFSKIRLSIKFSHIALKEIREFGNFGFSAVLANIFLILLLSSDRYIIKLYSKFADVGIYNQVYNLGQITIAALANIYISTVTPKLTEALENNLASSTKMVRLFITQNILLIFPLTVYFSLFARQISLFLLGEQFQSGYTMIPFIMLSSYMYGITQPVIFKLKFENRLTLIVIYTMLAAILNIVLNLLLIPVYGYKIAAATTLVSYLFLYIVISHSGKIRLFSQQKFRSFFLKICFILSSQVIADQVIRHVLNIKINLFLTIFEGLVFLVIFYWIMSKSEFKNMIRSIQNPFSRNNTGSASR